MSNFIKTQKSYYVNYNLTEDNNLKANGNDKVTGNYYLGLDVGTNSVGWAVTDEEYNLARLCGKDAWGVRLMDEGQTSAARRLYRTNRRRMQRKKWRLSLLRELFAEEIGKIDAGFYQRMDESSRIADDRKSSTKYTLFVNGGYTDKDYYNQYKTVYHLRKELYESKDPHDPRLVYLAIHHILKSRGHFLYSLTSDEDMSFKQLWQEFAAQVKERFDLDISVSDIDSVKDILCNTNLVKKDKYIELNKICKLNNETDIDIKTFKKIQESLIKLCAGNTVELNKMFFDREFEDKESISLCDGEEKLAQVCDILGDDAEIILAAKAMCDKAILDGITKNFNTFSEYKVEQYDEHKRDIDLLKEYVKKVLNDKALAREIFNVQPIKKAKKSNVDDDGDGSDVKAVPNYAAYSKYKKGDVAGSVSQENFCKFLKKKLGDLPNGVDKKYIDMMNKISNGIFAPKLRTTDNGIIPNALHRKELEVILSNASEYLPFLKEKDESGLSVADKIMAIFDYKLPYYIGPLKGGKSWAVRISGKENEKIKPWNFKEIIDSEASAEKFIDRMTAICTYTGEKVLPFDSLLYSEFCVLNEINNIKVNGKAIDVDTKRRIYEELFVKSRKKVTKKSIFQFLKAEGLAKATDIIDGVDDQLTSSLRSHHDMKRIIDKTSYETAESIIRRVVLLGNDKKMLADWVRKNTSLREDDIKYICRLKYKNWGRLSETFLTGIYDVDKTSGSGEMLSIIQAMRDTNENLMQLLSDRYEYAEQAARCKADNLGVSGNPREMVDDLYVSPKIRRSIWQSMRIIDEIIDIKKSAPKKIFIEVARDVNDESKKGKRTDSRKKQLIDQYKLCEREGKQLLEVIGKSRFAELKEKLESEDDSKMGKHLYLYYRQFGKCMYSGESIDISQLNNKKLYDIDHIYPRSKIKDDSFDNTVLVKAELNRDKTNIYPIEEKIRTKMYPFWKHLSDIKAISPKKFERLTRHTPLTQDELSEFINRQLVETRQSTKALAEILGNIYGKGKIVYSKAGNVSDFRDYFKMLKCRDINDLHHAHDAYLNIVVGNYFDTRFTDKFRKNIANETYNLKTEKLYAFNVKGAWTAGGSGSISTVRKVMSKCSVLYSRMPHEVKGGLFDVNPRKKKDGLIPLRKGEYTAIYGGYDKGKGAYWALVERVKKQKKSVKTTRSLEAVFIMDKKEYERDPQAFATAHWLDKSDGIRVIIPKIMRYSLFELDGVRVHITGRTGDRLICMHANQLYIKYEDIIKFRKIIKYVDRCKNSNKALPVHDSDGVDIDTCRYLYDIIIGKLEQPVYKIVPSVCKYMKELRENFIKSQDALVRCKVLLQCLNALRCNALITDLTSIGGNAKVGTIRISKIISNFNSAYLINQSPTGLYEKKIDLLN